MLAQRTLFIGGQLFLLALTAFFGATTVNGFVAMALRSKVSVDLSEPTDVAAAPVKRQATYFAPITEQDIFNPRRQEDAAPVAVSDLKAKLLGTAPGEGIDSFAIIEDQNNKKQELYRVGDRFQNRTVQKIEWDRVVLRNGNRDEILKIVEATGSAPGAVSTAAAGGIAQQSDTEFQIDRSEVDNAMANLNQLFTQIRAVPHFQDGKASGFRLFAIRRQSIFEKIGLKNGDIVSSINGNELSDPARAMELLQQLKDESQITVNVTRNRQPTTLTYEIR